MAAYAGCRVKILTDEGEYAGCVHALEQNSKRLTLDDVSLLPSGKKVQGLRHFFGDEIIRLEVVGENEDTEKKTTKCPKPESNVPYQLLPSGIKPNFTIISDTGQSFQEMLAELWQEGIFGIAFFGSGYERFGQLSLVMIQTRKKRYMVDALRASPAVFVEGLGNILEANQVIKVLHDCRWVSDHLFHQFSIKLANVFDTQVADLMVSKQKNGELPQMVSSLGDCLLAHLGVDFQHVYALNQLESSMQADDWQRRPLDAESVNFATESVEHLLALRKSLLFKLLAEFHVSVDVYLSTVRNSSQQGNTVTRGKARYLPQEFRSNWKFKLPSLIEAELNKSPEAVVTTDDQDHIHARLQDTVKTTPTKQSASKTVEDASDKENDRRSNEAIAERPDRTSPSPSGKSLSDELRWQRGRGRGILIQKEPHRNERFKAEATHGHRQVTFPHQAVDFPTGEEIGNFERRNQALRRKGEIEEDNFAGD